MDLDVVLTREARTTGRGVIIASNAAAMVAGIRGRLGERGRIGRLRILDAFGSSPVHPLKAYSELSQLRPLFDRGGRVELYSTPRPGSGGVANVPGGAGEFSGSGFGGALPRGSSPISDGGIGGFNGGLQGFGGGGSRIAGTARTTVANPPELTAALGVPVTIGR